MAIADFIRTIISPKAEQRHTFKQPDKWSFLGNPSGAGVEVSEQTALSLSAVYSCVRIISESLAALPLVTYRNTDDGRRQADDLPIYNILRDQADENLTAFMLFETIISHACTYGNGFAYITRNGRGEVTALTPVDPRNVEVKMTTSGRVAYEFTTGQFQGAWTSDQVLHIRALGPLGLVGYSPIGLARETIGLGIAAEQYGANWFGNSGTPSGILSVPGKLSDEAFGNLRRSWEKLHKGAGNSARVALLEAGIDFKPISVNPNDAQFLETRRFQVAEIARIFRVPPSMLADLENAGSYGSIGELNRAFVVHTLTPWARRIESEIKAKLLPTTGGVFAEFQFDHLLRGDLDSRFKAYQTARQAGFLSVNDIRKIENLDPIGGNGDLYLSPLNMEALKPGDAPEPMPMEDEQRALPTVDVVALRDAARGNAKPNWERALTTIAQAEVNAAQRQLDREPGKVAEWAEKFYEGEYQRLAFRQILPALTELGNQLANITGDELGRNPGQLSVEALENMARRFATRRSRRSAQSIVASENRDGVVASWANGAHSTDIIDDEMRRAEGSIVLELYRQAGVNQVVWRALGTNAPVSLNGVTVKPGEPFILRGQTVTYTDGTTYEPRTDIRHSPIKTGDVSIIQAV